MVGVALVTYVLLVWYRPHLALGVLLCVIPFGHLVRFSIAGIPFTFPEMAAYVLALALLLRGNVRQFRVIRDPWIVLPFLWVVIATIAAVGSPAGMRAWGIWKAYVVAPVLLFWSIRAMRDELDVMRDVITPLAFSAFVVAVLALAQRWWPIGIPYPWDQPGQFRATSVFGYPNAVGLYLAPLVPLFVGAALVWRTPAPARSSSQSEGWSTFVRVGFAIAALLSLLAILLARSTGALVALGAVVPLLVWCPWSMHRGTSELSEPSGTHYTKIHDRGNKCSPRGVARWAVVVIGAWVTASLVLTAWLPYQRERPRWGPPIVQKLTFQQWSGSVRLSQYRETWALLRDYPIRGAGLAGYQTAIVPYHEKRDVEIFLYPHDLLLAVWVELGLAGLLVFLAMLYQFFRQPCASPLIGRGSERVWGQYGIVAAMLVILIHGLVDVPYFKHDLAMVFWVIVAIGVATSAGKLGDHLTAAASPPMLPSR